MTDIITVAPTVQRVQVSAPGAVTVSRDLAPTVTVASPGPAGFTADTIVAAPTGFAAIDQVAIQAAFDSVPDGGKVKFREGRYRLLDGITTAVPNVAIEGTGNVGQNSTLGNGATSIEVPSGEVGLTFGDGLSTIFRGPKIKDLHFVDVSGAAVGGVRLLRVNNFVVENVCCSNFTAGYGIQSDGTGNVNQYGVLIEPKLNDCLTGLDLIESNGTRVIGGAIDANNNSGAVRASSIGVRVRSGDTTRLFGTIIQFAATGVYFEGGTDHELHGTRIEGCTIGARIAADRCSLVAGTWNNNIIGGGGTGIQVDAAADNTLILNAGIVAVATPFTDAGTNTVSLLDRVWRLPDAGEFRIGAGIVLSRKGTGNLRVTNNLYVDESVVIADTVAGGKILFGNAQDTELSRSAANTLATGANDAFKTGRFTTAARPSAATHGDSAQIYDTDLNKPLWSDGTDWRDATGTVV